MAVQWNSIYLSVCSTLLEDNGFQLGICTQEQFQQLAAEIQADLCAKTGLNKRIFNIVFQAGVYSYPFSTQVGEVQAANGLQSNLLESSDWMISQSQTDWMIQPNGAPAQYKQDSLPPLSITVQPAPQLQGSQITTPAGMPGYGVPCSTSNVTDFDIACAPGQQGFGVICSSLGNPYLETTNPGYGAIASMVPSLSNLTLFAAALPYQVSQVQLADYVELIPDMFTPYLRYGILAVLWNTNSEIKDSQKAAYSSARYQEGINALASILCGEYTEDS
jgi:hypothetical protein